LHILFVNTSHIEIVLQIELFIVATPCYAQWFRHTCWRFVTLVCRWKERPSSDRTLDERKSAIRFHKISINRPPSDASNSMGKRDRKSRFSTHWRNSPLTRFALFNLFRFYQRRTLIILLERKQFALCFTSPLSHSLLTHVREYIMNVDELMSISNLIWL